MTSGYGAADCDITLNNSHRKYTAENIGSPYYGLIKSNLRLVIELGFEEQTVKKIEAFATSFSMDSSKRSFVIRGQDYVKKFLSKTIENEDFSSSVFVNKSLAFLIKVLALDCDFPIEKVRVDDTTLNAVVPYAFFRQKQVWKEMQDLCLAYESEIYVTEDGYLVVRDRFRSKGIYKSPRYSKKNYVQSICHNDTNDFTYLVVNSED